MSLNPEPHLANAPIVEAVIAFQCRIGIEGDHAWIESVAAAFGAEVISAYPVKEPMHQARFTFDGKLATAAHEVMGYRFKDPSGTQVIQIYEGGFTFSRLRPYQHWSLMRQEAAEQWARFKRLVGNPEVVSCSLRYINKIQIPAECPISDYLTVYPTVPGSLFTSSVSYIFRSEGKMTEPDCTAVLQQVQLPNETPSEINLVIDNDFRIDATNFSDGEMWAKLDELRTLKNRIFFETLTSKALEMFN